jgi:hypothetical protein
LIQLEPIKRRARHLLSEGGILIGRTFLGDQSGLPGSDAPSFDDVSASLGQFAFEDHAPTARSATD